MDYLTQQFIALARKLIHQLDTLHKDLKDAVVQIGAYSKSNKEPSEPNPPEPPTKIELISPVETRAEASEKQSTKKYQCWTLVMQGMTVFVTFLAFLAAAYYAFVAKGQLEQTIVSGQQTNRLICLYRDQLKLIGQEVDQLKVMAQAEKARLFPNLLITAFNINPPTQTGEVVTTCEVKNIGLLPALDVEIEVVQVSEDNVKVRGNGNVYVNIPPKRPGNATQPRITIAAGDRTHGNPCAHYRGLEEQGPEILDTHPHIIVLYVTWKGEPLGTHDCRMWDSRTHTFIPCPPPSPS